MIEIILQKYFLEKKSQTEIAKELNISKSKVSRIVSKDERYILEKERRKKVNQVKNIEFTKDYIKRIRKNKGVDLDYIILRKLHDQASRELSGGKKPINDRAYRDWNPSIYMYNEKNNSYVLKKGIKVGADVPTKIKWKNF